MLYPVAKNHARQIHIPWWPKKDRYLCLWCHYFGSRLKQWKGVLNKLIRAQWNW